MGAFSLKDKGDSVGYLEALGSQGSVTSFDPPCCLSLSYHLILKEM
jgi:hypothetical protein